MIINDYDDDRDDYDDDFDKKISVVKLCRF